MMIKPALVVMAAGMGSRYGGLKQLDPIGPNGEMMIDYSIYDALKAGFGKVIFVIKDEIEEIFRVKIGSRIERIIETAYVLQKIEDIPGIYTAPPERIKPWGTAHAVMSCRHMIDTPFAVINADDYYGPASFQVLFDFLKEVQDTDGIHQYCMAGFKLENTLTEHGHVARGICTVDSEGYLTDIHERTEIQKFGDIPKYTEDGEHWIELPAGCTVSMNAWGFTPSLFKELELGFPKFLEENRENIAKAEYYLPSVVNRLIKEGKAAVKVLPSKERWYGVTYKEDKPVVKQAISDLINKKVYKSTLWEIQYE